jgi:hypothetical protein
MILCCRIVRGSVCPDRRGPKPTAVPQDLKPHVLKKFSVRPMKHLAVIVTRIPVGGGYAVATIPKQVPTVVREFRHDQIDHIPEPLRLPFQTRMAIWYGRYIAHHGLQPPSQRRERSRRRRILRVVLANHQHQMTTKIALKKVTGGRLPPPPPPVPAASTFVLIYHPEHDPMSLLQPTTFVLHSTACDKLDGVRRTAVRKGGDSWVMEFPNPETAVRAQVAEFEEDDKGYDTADFTIHECCYRR